MCWTTQINNFKPLKLGFESLFCSKCIMTKLISSFNPWTHRQHVLYSYIHICLQQDNPKIPIIKIEKMSLIFKSILIKNSHS